MKPYIIVHMMASVDGRIDCPMVDQLSADEYYIALDSFGLCSKLSGRVTAALECSSVKRGNTVPAGGFAIRQESVFCAQQSDEYTIIADTCGKLRWASNEADGHPLLCIVSEKVTDEYLEHLRELGISWIATGEDRINLSRAMDILGEQFGIKQLAIVGGGHICGGFLEAGLVDEVSVMIAPGIDGRQGQTAVFDGIINRGCKPYRLKLTSVKQWESDVIWLRYRTTK